MNFDYSSNRFGLIMSITKSCPPKEFGAHVCSKKSKMRGGWKRK